MPDTIQLTLTPVERLDLARALVLTEPHCNFIHNPDARTAFESVLAKLRAPSINLHLAQTTLDGYETYVMSLMILQYQEMKNLYNGIPGMTPNMENALDFVFNSVAEDCKTA